MHTLAVLERFSQRVAVNVRLVFDYVYGAFVGVELS